MGALRGDKRCKGVRGTWGGCRFILIHAATDVTVAYPTDGTRAWNASRTYKKEERGRGERVGRVGIYAKDEGEGKTEMRMRWACV